MHIEESVSRETTDRIAKFCEMIVHWNKSINLIAPATVAELEDRHVKDSAQLIQFLPAGTRHWLDLGSGGGFPSMIVAAYLAEKAPDCRVTMIESDQRKAVFLRQAVRTMSLQATVIADRIEQVTPQEANVISARALAPLTALLSFADRHIAPGGTCLFLKGQNSEAELSDATQAGWSFTSERHKSQTDPNGTILLVRNIARERSS